MKKTYKQCIFIFIIFTIIFSASVLAGDTHNCSEDYGICTLDSFDKQNSSTDVAGKNLTNATNKGIKLYFFYGEGCPHCASIEPIVNSLSSCVSIKTYEVYHNTENQKIFKDFLDRYCVPKEKRGVPAIFVGSFALVGEEEIKEQVDEKIALAIKEGIDPMTYRNDSCKLEYGEGYKDITILTVIGAAIVDSFNPCAIGVLVIFLSFLLSTQKFPRRRVILYGAVYISSVYFIYFLAGIGILKFLQNFEFLIFVQILVVAFLLIGALLAFRDVYKTIKKTGEPLLAIPKSAKGRIEKYINKLTFPVAVLLGMLVAVVELPCTGQVYLGILTLLTSVNYTHGVLLLLIYNLIFVLPLIMLLVLALLGKNLSGFLEAKEEVSWVMRYFIGWVMILLAVVVTQQIMSSVLIEPNIIVPFFDSLSGNDFFIFAITSILILFIFFAVIKPFVALKINTFYCALCYACATTWIFLVFLYIASVNVPAILLAGLMGMSIAGVWEEMKKFNFKYFGLFTIFLMVFAITLFYSIFIEDKFRLFLLILIFLSLDGIILLKQWIEKSKEKENVKPEEKKFKKERRDEKEKKSLRDLLDHCCD